MTQDKDILELLERVAHLMELAGENPFKIRAFKNAAAILEGEKQIATLALSGQLTKIKGIGKGIEEVVLDYVRLGTSSVQKELEAELPQGLLELVKVPGLGPKKARVLIQELGIQSLSELEYACQENRLLKLKGFGDKAQNKILEGARFLQASQGQSRLVEAEEAAAAAMRDLGKLLPKDSKIFVTGEIRRKREVISQIELLVAGKTEAEIKRAVSKFKKNSSLPVSIHTCNFSDLGTRWIESTGTEEHLTALKKLGPLPKGQDENAIYLGLGIPWVSPELRETGEEISLAKAGDLSSIVEEASVKGVFHNHTTYSDGTGSIEEMVVAAKALGYKYIGISDHSQSAFYAQGLKEDALQKQEREIKKAQDRHPEIRVFWGIESDILKDGSLDYPERILKRFDFVVASVHSRFGLDRETMTRRIITAIQNPHTCILGHPTGRLLLGRPAYEVDMERVIQAATKSNVAIEINAHPARLDLDWRWGKTLRENKTLVMINPDAHSTEGLGDTKYGVTVARKGLLPATQVLNNLTADEIGSWLKKRQKS